jgi:hypothetical protein
MHGISLDFLIHKIKQDAINNHFTRSYSRGCITLVGQYLPTNG